MKVTIVLLFTIMVFCLIGSMVLESDWFFKSAPTYIKNPTTNTHSINQSEAMDVLKAGYYMGGVRQRQNEDLDKYWKSDSLYFVKSFFTTIK